MMDPETLQLVKQINEEAQRAIRRIKIIVGLLALSYLLLAMYVVVTWP